ncbi:MAG: hypothetical protein JWP14_2914 [Frankiales bacterium]|nr:hypothetical protein [Frankiales bacterium]
MALGGKTHVVAVLATLLAGCLVATTLATVATSAAASDEATAGVAPPSAPCTRPAPRTAAAYQAMFDAKNDATWAGGDQAATVPLPGGRVLWLFGDTIRGTRRPDGSRSPASAFVHNSMLVQTRGCLVAVPAAAEVIPSPRAGEWYWPQDGVRQGDRLVVFCARVRRTGPGTADFTTVGVDAAVFSLRSGLPVLERVAATPSSHTPERGDQYGKAVVTVGGLLYVYGSRGVPGTFGRAVTVARVRPTALLDPTAWRYWTGSGWSRRASTARPVVPAGRHGWSTAFSVFRGADGRLHGLSKEEDVFGRSVVTGTATGPTSAFTRRVVLDAPSRRSGVLLYNALAHPGLPLAGGLLLVSVCRNSADLDQVWADADLYKPRFAAVRA